MSLPAVELSVASLVIFQTLIILIMSLLLARYLKLEHRTHKAVRDWYEQKSMWLAHEANVVRNNSLQELFVIRRNLELVTTQRSGIDLEQCQTWLQQLESLQNSLNNFIEHLVPPFLEESLPLATAAYLTRVKSQKENFKFTIESADSWQSIDYLHVSKAVLTFIQALESDMGASDGISAINLSFVQAKYEKQVFIQLGCLSPINDKVRRKIYDLCRIVSLLSTIKYRILLEESYLFVEFRWFNVEEQ